MSSSKFRPILYAILTGAAYYFGGKLGVAFKPGAFPISTLWPPNPILFSALLLAPIEIWWLILLAVLPAHLLVQLPSNVPLLRSLGWFISNTTEALLGAVLLYSCVRGKSCFESLRGV